MLELDKHQQPETIYNNRNLQDAIIRKPFKKGKNHKAKPLEMSQNILNGRSSRLSDFNTTLTPIPKFRLSIDPKISSLLDFGIVPDMPLTCRDLLRLRQDKNQRINITDFISKTTQKQIISFNHVSDVQDFSIEKSQPEGSKKMISPAFSFTGLSNFETHSVRNSRTYQTLPPIQSKDFESFPKFKKFEGREENLKKLDKIVGDCESALKDGKKKLKGLNNQVSCMKNYYNFKSKNQKKNFLE